MMGSKALVIEDDLDTAALYGHILEFLGFQTEIIRSGEQALGRLRQTVPDVVLLDMQLSHQVSGGTILKYIHQDARLEQCCVIVITGHPNLAEEVEQQVDLVLIKPISAKQLSTMVLRLCPNHVSENFLYNASHDPLTGLMNYPQFKSRVDHAISRAKRVNGLSFGIIFVQVVNIGTLKQELGQAGLNLLLIEMVNRIKVTVREVDIFARLRDDKFGILLENVQDPANIGVIIRRIEATLVEPVVVGEQEVMVAVDMRVSSADLEADLRNYVGL